MKERLKVMKEIFGLFFHFPPGLFKNQMKKVNKKFAISILLRKKKLPNLTKSFPELLTTHRMHLIHFDCSFENCNFSRAHNSSSIIIGKVIIFIRV